jgi:hypothetical protein
MVTSQEKVFLILVLREAGMRKLCSLGYRGLVAAVLLFALAPAQMASMEQDRLPGALGAPLFRHAPLRLLTTPGGVALRGPRNEFTSNNWSGYALTAGGYTSASFSWTVPTVSYVNYPSSPTFESSSSWVGIGGFASSDLIQLGTEQYVDENGNTIYRPWYELLPASETLLPPQYTISPGDAMSASLACTANCTAGNASMSWHLSMTNSTKSWTWTGDFTYKSGLSSVEWIQEAPTYGSIVAIPNFGTVNFTNLLRWRQSKYFTVCRWHHPARPCRWVFHAVRGYRRQSLSRCVGPNVRHCHRQP